MEFHAVKKQSLLIPMLYKYDSHYDISALPHIKGLQNTILVTLYLEASGLRPIGIFKILHHYDISTTLMTIPFVPSFNLIYLIYQNARETSK
jgi:hypothetical protein